MDPYKSGRLNASIQKVLGELLQRSVKDPRLDAVSISGVELNRDHSVARVFYTVLGQEGGDGPGPSADALKKARRYLQQQVGRTLHLRQAPELRFVPDEAIDRGFGVEAVLRDLEARGELTDEAQRRRRLTLADLRPPAELLRGLAAGQRFWICPHWNPDPDAMGSALALAAALRARGAAADVLTFPDAPACFAALPGHRAALLPARARELWERGERPDTLVMVDCHRRDRAGEELTPLLERVPQAWCVDHHLVSGRRLPLPGWLEEAAPATAVLVHRVVEALAHGEPDGQAPFAVDLDMATNLYAGLVNDTGAFRFPNTLPLAFELAAELARAGVDVAGVAEATLFRRTRPALALLERVLGTFAFHAEGRILTLRADRAMLAQTRAAVADTEGIIGVATSAAGVALVAFFKELDPGVWRVSLRAPGGGDVQQVAARFGGGGHRAAAGCTVTGEIAELERQLVDALLETL